MVIWDDDGDNDGRLSVVVVKTYLVSLSLLFNNSIIVSCRYRCLLCTLVDRYIFSIISQEKLRGATNKSHSLTTLFLLQVMHTRHYLRGFVNFIAE
jgi:hypothetical protein